MQVELEPCPCCGGEAETRLFIKNTFDVYCTCCGLMTPLYDTEAEAVEAWNTRVYTEGRWWSDEHESHDG